MVTVVCIIVFFFNDTATTEIYTLSLHDALPIYAMILAVPLAVMGAVYTAMFMHPHLRAIVKPGIEKIGRAHV